MRGCCWGCATLTIRADSRRLACSACLMKAAKEHWRHDFRFNARGAVARLGLVWQTVSQLHCRVMNKL